MAPQTEKVTGDLTISKAEVEKMGHQLRQRFAKEAEDNPNDYDVVDVEKVKNDDWYCQRFILHQRFLLGDKADVEAALEQCKTALKWRKEFNANSIKESNVSIEMFEMKGVFPYGKDKLGNDILVLIGKLHKRDAEVQKEIRRLLTFWIEKLDKQSNGNKINVIINCDGAGISNLDLDIIRFIFNTFRANYPYFLENIFVFNMPWIFNAAWKLIKTWLPEDAVHKIKFVNKKNILEYIDAESLPESMGGTRPEDEDNKHLEDYKRAVKQQLEEAMRGPEPSATKDKGNEKSGVSYLEVKPGHSLKFSNTEVSDRKPVFLVLKNICSQGIGFRIRSNNTRAFKVTPFHGVIESASSRDVAIQLSEGHMVDGREKFLLQAIPVGHSKLSPGSFNALWKNCNRVKQMEYKIKCVFEEVTEAIVVPVQIKPLGTAVNLQTSASSVITNDAHSRKITELETSIQELKYWNRLLKIAVFFLILVNVCFFAVYFFNDELRDLFHNATNQFQNLSARNNLNV